MKLTAAVLTVLLAALLLFNLGRLYQTEQHKVCQCDTCIETHYESIRRAHPCLPPID